MKDWLGRLVLAVGVCLATLSLGAGPMLSLALAQGTDSHGAAMDSHGDAQGGGAHGPEAHAGDAHGTEAHGESGHAADAHGTDGHGDAGHGDDGHGSGGLPQLDFAWFPTQIFWLALCFTLLYFLSAGAALPRVAEIIEARESRIAHDLDRADELQNEAQALARETDAILANARSQARAMVTKALEEADEEKVDRMHEHETDIVRRVADAELRIQQEKMNALTETSSLAVELAQALAEKLAGAKPDVAATRKAVDTVREERASA